MRDVMVPDDRDGVVQCAFSGPVTVTDLWAAAAEARALGSSLQLGATGD